MSGMENTPLTDPTEVESLGSEDSQEGDAGAGATPATSSEQGSEGQRRCKETLSPLEARMVRLELAVAEGDVRWERAATRLEELETSTEELRGELQGALNVAVDSLQQRDSQLEAMVRALQAEVQELKSEVNLCKLALSNQPSLSFPTAKMEVPKPKAFGVSRNAREVENCIFSLEQYFTALGLEDDAARLRTAPLYLVDTGTLWWRRRQGDTERGADPISTWEEFKREIKRQFYPEHAEDDAHAKLRRLNHNGTIRDYVKEFSELTLEIPGLMDKDILFSFMDGLQPWAKLELQRRGVQDLAQAIAVAESLIEFRRGDLKGKGGKGAGSSKEPNPPNPKLAKEKGGNGGERPRPKLACFLCEGPHRVSECPKKGK